MENLLNSLQVKCLESLVGITKKECECFPEMPDALQAEIKNSISGMYIDEHEGAVDCLFLTKASCGEGSIWERLIEARKQAILKLILDVSVDPNNRYRPNDIYKHNLGESTHSTTLNNLQPQTVGFQFTVSNKRARKLLFTRMAFPVKLLNGASEKTVQINVKRVGETEDIIAFNFRLEMRSNNYGGLRPDEQYYDIPNFELPCDGSTYQISYDFDGTFLPYDKKLTCNCGGVRKSMKDFYANIPDGFSYGMSFDVSYKCEEQFLLCSLAYENYTMLGLISQAIVSGTMLRFLTIEQSKKNTGVTPSSVLNIQDFDGLIGAYSALYLQAVSNISLDSRNFVNVDCFVCSSGNRAIKRQGMIVTDNLYIDDFGNFTEVPQDNNYTNDNVPIFAQNRIFNW